MIDVKMPDTELTMNRYQPQIETFQRIVQRYRGFESLRRVLDLGCGKGLETAYLHRLTGAQAFGIDVNQEFDPWASNVAWLANYDGEHIPLTADFLDAVYSFHVLEHVGELQKVLTEVRRVLKPKGVAYFGVPNKRRLLGYFGMSDKSLADKIRQNLLDWKLRFCHRFENALGAHAGFKEGELVRMLAAYFPKVIPVTAQYYQYKHERLRSAFKILAQVGLQQLIWPSVYVVCIK